MCHNIINFVLQRILNLRVLKHGKYLPLLVLFRNLPIRKADTDFKPAGSAPADREMQCLLLSAVCPPNLRALPTNRFRLPNACNRDLVCTVRRNQAGILSRHFAYVKRVFTTGADRRPEQSSSVSVKLPSAPW